MWVPGVGCWMWVRRLRVVVGRDGGFSDVCGWPLAGSSGAGVGWVLVVVVAGLLGGCGVGGRP